LCFVCLHHMSYVPSVASVSGLVPVLFVFIICLAYPVLPLYLVSSLLCFLFCLSSSYVLRAQCCLCIWSRLCCVCLHHMSSVPSVAFVSGLCCVFCCVCLHHMSCPVLPLYLVSVVYFVLFVFIICLAFPVLPLYLVSSLLCILFCLSSSYV
jgi:hypothetical protein